MNYKKRGLEAVALAMMSGAFSGGTSRGFQTKTPWKKPELDRNGAPVSRKKHGYTREQKKKIDHRRKRNRMARRSRQINARK